MSDTEGVWGRSAPVVLRALTLRGIGSYGGGARLDLRPLTVLCGGNGSGKSTWARCITTLREALNGDRVPFAVASLPKTTDNDWSLALGSARSTPGLVNILVQDYLATDRDYAEDVVAQTPRSAEEEEKRRNYGPPGTIGLEFNVRNSCLLTSAVAPSPADEPEGPRSTFAEFLDTGRCLSGWRIRVRLTLWSLLHAMGQSATFPCDGAEIAIDGIGRLCVWPSANRDSDSGRMSILFQSGDEIDPVGSIRVDKSTRSYLIEPGDDDSPIVPFLFRFPGRVRDLVRIAVDSCFHVGPVRDIHAYDELTSIPTAEQNLHDARDVGVRGEKTFVLLQRFGGERLRQPKPPYHALLRPEAYSVTASPDGARALLGSLLLTAGAPHPDAAPADLAKDLRERTPLEAASEYVDLKWGRGWCPPDPNPWVASRYAAALRDLLPTDLRNDIARVVADKNALPSDLEGVMRRVIEALQQRFPWPADLMMPQERAWCLRRLLEHCASNAGPVAAQQYNVDFFVSVWLRRIVQAAIGWTHGVVGVDCAQDWDARTLPNGYLVSAPEQRERDAGRALNRFLHPCFGDQVSAPINFSSGFHQVAPIVLQAALMREGECLFIENPEVHLHPRAQLDFTEFLVQQANAGKLMIVETHSDLLLRRVLSAVLTEEFAKGQGSLFVYFTRLVNQGGVSLSELDEMRVNAQGQVLNWPEEFLGVHTAEAQRLVELMHPEYFGGGGDASEAGNVE